MFVEDRRAASRKLIKAILARDGKVVTDEEIHENLIRMTHYTPEEAARRIKGIKKSRRTWFCFENGTNEPVTYMADELIEMIQRSTLPCQN